MKKVPLILLIGAFALVGCSTNELPENLTTEEPNDTIQTISPLELFYQTKTFGFRVKDTTNLDLIHSYVINNNEITFLTGRRNERLWIAKFNTQTKEQISEFVDTERLNLTQKIHHGYGEYEDVVISSIILVQFIESEDLVLINVQLNGGLSGYKSLILFNNNPSNRKEYTFDNSSLFFSDWYANSYITNISNTVSSSATIFGKNGNIILEGIENYGFPNVEMTASYTDYLWIGFLWQNDTQPTIIRTWLGKHSLNNNRWSKWLQILKEKGAKYEWKIISKEGNVWLFRFDVLEYSGERHSHDFKINVDNGMLLE